MLIRNQERRHGAATGELAGGREVEGDDLQHLQLILVANGKRNLFYRKKRFTVCYINDKILDLPNLPIQFLSFSAISPSSVSSHSSSGRTVSSSANMPIAVTGNRKSFSNHRERFRYGKNLLI